MDLAEASVLALRLALALGLYAFLFALIRAANGWLVAEPAAAAAVVTPPQPAAQVFPLRLQPLDATESGVLTLQDGETLGRGSRANLQIAHPTVSSNHARVESDGRHWLITDLESTNGTRVNDQPVRGSAPLSAGDIVSLGDVRFRVM